ncbi:hypothetical protein PWT90_03496 [Aphanocladium album]|nr:hypothetical protein PWT90_03496 [Aphanocladium album]
MAAARSSSATKRYSETQRCPVEPVAHPSPHHATSTPIICSIADNECLFKATNVDKAKLTCLCTHLLGKKSWNVYNKDNIERVRRDEANAKAAEEAEEQRMQEVDAARRLAILRGETPPPIEQDEETTDAPDSAGGASRQSHSLGAGRRPRKRHGEDDTDFELRVAQEREEAVSRAAAEARRTTSSAPIVDRRGNIDLFGGDDKSRAHAEKNEEAEQETRRKKREYEDQYTMRFSNAGGQPGLAAPWYSAADGAKEPRSQVMKNVWGRDDPQRKERDEKRIAASDPLAMMKQGAAKVRELRHERKKFQDERDRELRQMRRDDERRERHGHHRSRRPRSRSPRSRSPRSEDRRRSSRDGRSSRGREDEERSRHGHRDGDRSRDRDRERRHRHRSRSREKERHRRHDGDEKRQK